MIKRRTPNTLLLFGALVGVAVTGTMSYGDPNGTGAPSPTSGQPTTEKKPPPDSPVKKTPEVEIAQPADMTSVSVTKIIEQASKNLGRRYNLSKVQSEHTERLMKNEVNKFLTDHHDQVWPLIRDLLAWQMRPDAATNPDDIRRVGKGAGRLMADIEKAIRDGNDAWREILTPEQMAVHDFDMAEMNKQFKQFEDNFAHMASEGKFKDDAGIFPAADPVAMAHQPPTPGRPEGLGKGAVVTIDADLFDRWVSEFIKDHELDEGQIDAAKSILNEFKGEISAYLASKKDELGDVERRRQEALNASELKKLREINERQRQVLKPIQDMLPAMDKRLHALLTTAQIERSEARKAAKAKERAAEKGATKGGGTEKAPAVEIQPKSGGEPAAPAPGDAKPTVPKPSAPGSEPQKPPTKPKPSDGAAGADSAKPSKPTKGPVAPPASKPSEEPPKKANP